MHKYLFLLGRQPKLSIAELKAVVGEGKVIGEFYMIEIKNEIDDPIKLQNMLGGTIKIAKIISQESSLIDIENKCMSYLGNHDDAKVIFSVSLYNFAHSFKKDLNNLLKNIKRRLKANGKGARFVNKPFENVRSVTIYEERLCQKGTDMTIIKLGREFVLAYSLAVQNFKQYSIRDYDRPARDAKSGMLPPKLAQIMTNIACGNNLSVVYDPFCGSGTVLMEALLQGHQVMGSDISEKAVNDTKKNLDWIENKFSSASGQVINIFQHDATTLQKSDFLIMPKVVVFEGYLGPSLSKFPPANERKKNFKDVSEVLFGALKAVNEILDAYADIVIAIPFYKGRDKKYFLANFVELLKNLNYKIINFDNSDTSRGSLLYYRENQIVGREIFHLKTTF